MKFLKGEGELHNLELDETTLSELLELPPWIRLTKAVCNRISAKASYYQHTKALLNLSYFLKHIKSWFTSEFVKNLFDSDIFRTKSFTQKQNNFGD